MPHAATGGPDARSRRSWANRATRLSRHVFVGGNAFMLRMLNRFRAELGVDALPRASSRRPRAATRRQIASGTRDRGDVQAERSNAALRFEVRREKPDRSQVSDRLSGAEGVAARGGARCPGTRGVQVRSTGSRRARFAQDNDADRPARFEPHHEEITRADEVQIYESILGDPAGRPTTGLLTATAYLKDNRLLPRGFDKATAAADIAVVGAAAVGLRFRRRDGSGALSGGAPPRDGVTESPRGAAVSADCVSMGPQSGRLRRAGATPLRRILRRSGRPRVRGRRHGRRRRSRPVRRRSSSAGP